MRSSYSGSVMGPKMSSWTLPRMFIPAPWTTRILGMCSSVVEMAGPRPRYRNRRRHPLRELTASRSGPASSGGNCSTLEPGRPVGTTARGIYSRNDRRASHGPDVSAHHARAGRHWAGAPLRGAGAGAGPRGRGVTRAPPRPDASLSDRLAAPRNGLHRVVPPAEQPAHAVPDHGARRAALVRPVRIRGDLGHLALPGRDRPRRRPLPRLRRSGERRDAGRPDRLGRSPWSRGTPELRLRPLPGPAAVPVNGHEPLPVGRARASLAGLPGALGRGLHRPRRARRLLRHGIAPPHPRRRLSVDVVSPPRRGASGLSPADRQDQPVLARDAGPRHRVIAPRRFVFYSGTT